MLERRRTDASAMRSSTLTGAASCSNRITTATLIAVEIVRKNPDQVGFAVNPRRVVERFFAWIGRNRRLAKDFEATIDSARAFHTPHPSCCSCDGWLVLHDFRNRL